MLLRLSTVLLGALTCLPPVDVQVTDGDDEGNMVVVVMDEEAVLVMMKIQDRRTHSADRRPCGG